MTPPVGLGTATPFAVLAGSGVTNTGTSVINGDVGVSPLAAVSGFPPGVRNGTLHAADAGADQAQTDLTTAYVDAAGRDPAVDTTGVDLGNRVLVPGVYEASGAMGLTGAVTLDAQGDPGAVFLFQVGSTLITGVGSSVVLVGGAQPCNVFWQVGSSATLDTSTSFVGTIMAQASISLEDSSTVQGRLLARSGAVTVINNVITRPTCASTPSSSAASASATPAATTLPSATPTKRPGRDTSSGSKGDGGGTKGGGTRDGGTKSGGSSDSPGGDGAPTGAPTGRRGAGGSTRHRRGRVRGGGHLRTRPGLAVGPSRCWPARRRTP